MDLNEIRYRNNLNSREEHKASLGPLLRRVSVHAALSVIHECGKVGNL